MSCLKARPTKLESLPQNVKPRPAENTYGTASIRKLGSAFKSEEAMCPASKWGYAAAAIMAALSVESAPLGKNTFPTLGVDLDVNVYRNSELAATPPDTRIVRAPVSAAAANVRVTRSLTTA